MHKLHITLYFTGKALQSVVWLRVYPFAWHLWPSVVSGRGSVPRSGKITILQLKEGHRWATEEKIGAATIDDFEPATFYRLYGSPRVLRFLCFRVGFLRRFTTELGDIYPRGYKYLKDTLHGVKVKYTRLIESGYFY